MTSQLIARDRKRVWHPFTQEKTAPYPLPIVSAEGVFLYDEDGKAYCDLISSWWTTIHGHGHPVLVEAVAQQIKTLDHVLFAGVTHEPAVSLCEKLSSVLPSSLERFFFSDNGSTSIEVALKIAWQYHRNCGNTERDLFLCFDGAYHGDTIGSMSLAPFSIFHQAFKGLFFDVAVLPYPHNDGINNLEKEEEALKNIEELLQYFHHRVAALVLEPRVQGAGGMRMTSVLFLERVMAMARRYSLLIIFDEVMTGFGRTGQLFALSSLQYAPDILCLSKALTGGILPMALTITSQEIYESFSDEDDAKAFLHGHTYTANPIACAAACASFDLLCTYEKQNIFKNLEQAHNLGLQYLADDLGHHIENLRICGTIAAFDIKNKKVLTSQLRQSFFQEGLLLRPLGSTVYLMPPFSIDLNILQNGYCKISKVLREVLKKF